MVDATYLISMPTTPFTLPRSFKAAANGKIFVGEVNTDPTSPTNQVQVYIEGENGTLVPIPQPIDINAGGFPVYSGQIVKFVAKTNHSMAVYDSYGVQLFYWPDLAKTDPQHILQLLAEPTGAALIGGLPSVTASSYGFTGAGNEL